MKKDVINGVNLKTKGYKILLEILVKGKYKRVKEFPYTFRMRKYSMSKLNTKEFLLFLGQIINYSFYKGIRLFKNEIFKFLQKEFSVGFSGKIKF